MKKVILFMILLMATTLSFSQLVNYTVTKIDTQKKIITAEFKKQRKVLKFKLTPDISTIRVGEIIYVNTSKAARDSTYTYRKGKKVYLKKEADQLIVR